jgi:hypothetical protein
MPKLEYFLVCESCSIDQATNRISLFNIIEEVQSGPPSSGDGMPIAQMVAVSCWNREDGDEDQDFQLTLRVHPPEGEYKDFRLNFRMDRPRHRFTIRLSGGVPAGASGTLRFETLLNDRHVADHVVLVHAPGREATAETPPLT